MDKIKKHLFFLVLSLLFFNISYAQETSSNTSSKAGVTVTELSKSFVKVGGVNYDLSKVKHLTKRTLTFVDSASSLLVVLAFFVLGLLICVLLPKCCQTAVDTFYASPWLCLALGFLAALVTPFTVILLMITGVGIVAGFVLMLLYALSFFIGYVLMALAIGKGGMKLAKIKLEELSKGKLILSLFIGLTTVYLFSLIPFLGLLLVMLVTLSGVGILIKTIFNFANKNSY